MIWVLSTLVSYCIKSDSYGKFWSTCHVKFQPIMIDQRRTLNCINDTELAMIPATPITCLAALNQDNFLLPSK